MGEATASLKMFCLTKWRLHDTRNNADDVNLSFVRYLVFRGMDEAAGADLLARVSVCVCGCTHWPMEVSWATDSSAARGIGDTKDGVPFRLHNPAA